MKLIILKSRIIILCSCMLLLSGCGGPETVVQTTSITLGQELLDLKKSYDKGIVTESEYDDAKEAILERYK